MLVADVDHALELKRSNPGWLVMGENGGKRIDGFDLSNSPVEAASADVAGRTIVQRTGAGTRGASAVTNATRMWCSSLVCATSTATALNVAGLGDPTYVITGDWPERADMNGEDDRLVAAFIESVRTGNGADHARTARAVADTDEAAKTLAIGEGHVDPADITYATDIDRFTFTMEATWADVGLVLRRHR